MRILFIFLVFLFLLFPFSSAFFATSILENFFKYVLNFIKNKIKQGESNIENLVSDIISLTSTLPSFFPSFNIHANTNPDIKRTEFEIVISRGYQMELHKIITSDNYILTAWRINKNVTKYDPVILQHGLLDSSFSFILNEPNESLAYILADQGYDVWLTNNRGDKYSNEHSEYISSSDARYWDFTYDEFAQYDLPAHINYIKAKTQREKVIYIGHSQGTTQFFARMTLDSSLQDSVKLFFGLGPVIYANNQQSFLINLVKTTYFAEFLYDINLNTFLYIHSDNVPFLGFLCGKVSGVCIDVVSLICGQTDVTHSNRSKMSVMASHEPGGTSMKNIVHWMQNLRGTKFQMFDYGKTKNLEKYGTEYPTPYNVDNLMNFTIPKYLFIGSKDYLANVDDYERLLDLLPKESTFSYSIEDYAHLDYIWGVDANEKIYQNIIKIMEEHEEKN